MRVKALTFTFILNNKLHIVSSGRIESQTQLRNDFLVFLSKTAEVYQEIASSDFKAQIFMDSKGGKKKDKQ